jgi:hypothetical protein
VGLAIWASGTGGAAKLSNRWAAISFAVCLALLLAPVLAIEHPPLMDYPNHLARLIILTRPDDPQLAQYYRVNWSLLPNLGFDLIGLGLAQVMPVYVVGRVFLALIVTVLLAALMALHRALYGQWSPLPLLGGPLLYNLAMQMGLMSFLLGTGLAITAFALWLGLRRAAPAGRFVALQLAVLVVFVCHLAATGVLAVLVVASAASEGWRGAQGGALSRLVAAARSAVPPVLAFLLPALLLIASKTGDTASEGVGFAVFYGKLMMIPLALMLDLTLASIALAALALIAPAAIARLGGGRALHPAVAWPVAILTLIYLPMPEKLLSSHMADWRLLIPLVLVIAGAAGNTAFGHRGLAAVAALALCINAGAAMNTWKLWRSGDQLTQELHTVLAELPEGGRLIPYQPELNFGTAVRPPSLFHIATTAVIERRALVVTVFAFPGQQPIAFREPHAGGYDWYLWLHRGGPEPPEMARLTDPVNHVLEIRTGREGPEPLEPLRLPADRLAQSEHFTLYRLRPGPAGG